MLLATLQNEKDVARDSFLSALSKFRPQESIFEVAALVKKGIKSNTQALLMQKRRGIFAERISKKVKAKDDFVREEVEKQRKILEREAVLGDHLEQDGVDFEGFHDLTVKSKFFFLFDFLFFNNLIVYYRKRKGKEK